MDVVEIARLSFRYLHLIGMATLVGSLAVQFLLRKYQTNPGMRIGGILVVVTGLILAAPWPRETQPDPAKLVIKLLLATATAVLVIIAERRQGEQKPLLIGAGVLALITVGVATFWT